MHACFLDSTCMLFVALKDKAPHFFMTEEDFEKLTEVANDEVRIFYYSFWTLNAPNVTPQKKQRKALMDEIAPYVLPPTEIPENWVSPLIL